MRSCPWPLSANPCPQRAFPPISGVASWSWEIGSERVQWSEKLFYLLGVAPGDIAPSLASTLEHVAAPDRDRLMTAIRGAQASGRHFVLQHDIVRGDGARRTVVSSGRTVPGRDGKGQRVVMTMQDLTEQIRLARELEAARAGAEAQAEFKTRLLAQISHELRTPLNALLGFGDLLAQAALDVEQGRHLGAMRETAGFLLDVVNDLLDLARIEAGQLRITRVPLALEPLLDHARAMTEVLLGTKAVRFHLERGDDVPRCLMGDPTRIRQVLTNLVGNAAKFTSSGSITLRVRKLDGEPAAPRLRFEVSDTGRGIPASQREGLFKPFIQLGEATDHHGRGPGGREPGGGGTGLGLAICREIVGLMAGSIGVESTEGLGSTFWFELPLTQAATPVRPLDAAASVAATRPLDILVADDVETNRQLVQAILAPPAHRTTTAADGQDAIAAVQRSLPDVVLMDVTKPRLDGLDAARAIRGLGGAFAELPIIAVTARTLPADLAACRAAGMTSYVAKPIDARELTRTITEATGERAPPRPAPQPASAAPPTLAVAQLEGLATRIGAEALRSLFHGILARVRSDGATIRSGLEREEAVMVGDAAHRLAGLCGSLGAPGLSRTSQAIEQAARARRLSTCAALLAELNELARLAHVEFSQIFA